MDAWSDPPATSVTGSAATFTMNASQRSNVAVVTYLFCPHLKKKKRKKYPVSKANIF